LGKCSRSADRHNNGDRSNNDGARSHSEGSSIM
jgi:hypothetical protein